MSDPKKKPISNFPAALSYAYELHHDQKRKSTEIPYMSHLMHVSAYVLEFGGDEDQAIAGLLHDAIEDQHERTNFETIRERFGAEVERIVRACTDAETSPKPPWKQRKETYLAALKKKDERVKLVVACDKLHNAQSIVRDVETHGEACWARFNAPKEELKWYYRGILESLEGLKGTPVHRVLKETVEKLLCL